MRNHPNQSGRPFETSDTLERLQGALTALEQRVGSTPTRRKSSYAPEPKPDLAAIRARQHAVDTERRQAERIRREIGDLRQDVDREMRTASGGFEVLREELRASRAPVERIEALHDEMRALRAPIEDAAGLRGEIDRLKAQVASLAREDSLRALIERWTDLEHQISDLPETLASHEDIATVSVRLDDMSEAISELPRNLQLDMLEEHLRALATAVERVALHSADPKPGVTEELEARLDEISRAIAAIPSMPSTGAGDPDTLQRLEARIGALAAQMDEIAQGQTPQIDYQDHFDELATRIDGLRIGIDPGTVSGEALDALSERVDGIVEAIQLLARQDSSGSDQAAMAVADLEDRLADITAQLQSSRVLTERSAQQIAESLDDRMAEIARRIDENERAQADVPSISQLDKRLEEIASLMAGTTVVPSQGADLSQLEARIADLAANFSPDRIAAFDEEAILTAARAAAEEVAQQAMVQNGTSPQTPEALNALTADLRALESLSRETDTRNSQTFGAIHETLLKVVDHLSSLEDKIATAPQPMPTTPPPAAPAFGPIQERETVRLADAPPLAADMAAPNEPVATDATLLAISEADRPLTEGGDAPAGGKKSILKNVTDRLSRGKGRDEDEPIDHGSEGFAVVDDQPIEPGADQGALADIMQRVRMERAGGNAQGAAADPRSLAAAEAGKSDFIAAARRAAQAAAADASALSNGANDAAGGATGLLSNLLANHRRPIIMGAGAIMLAILALPLIRGLIDTGPQTAARTTSPPVPIVETVPESAPAADIGPLIDSDAGSSAARDVTIDAQLPVPGSEPVESASAPIDAAPLGPVVTDAAEPITLTDPIDLAEPPVIDAAPVSVAAYDDIPDNIGPIALRDAAADGDPKALYVIGDTLAQASGGQGSNLVEAFKWYKRSAELGYAPAQYRAGNFLEKGFGTERDVDAAKTWYQLAAEQGNATAMHNLAVLFASGADGAPDFDSAARWFQRAAELGVRDSQFNLGILAARGQGVTQDLGESYKWFALAAQSGDTDAAAKRDDVANVLTADQLQIARGATALWKPEPVDEDVNVVDVPEAWQTDQQRTAAAPPLSDADMQKAVSNIQAILNQNGYDAGPVDGIMGQKTRDAIIAFQRDNDLAATGNVDQALVQKLLQLGDPNG